MLEDADDYTVARHLEAYLLWLFGWIMFTSTHGNSVRKELIHYAREVVDALIKAVPHLVHSDAVFAEYLRWYLLRTRTRVTYTPPDVVQWTPALTDTYPVQHEQAVAYGMSHFIIQTPTLMITYI